MLWMVRAPSYALRAAARVSGPRQDRIVAPMFQAEGAPLDRSPTDRVNKQVAATVVAP